jgi:streptogramin lyase
VIQPSKNAVTEHFEHVPPPWFRLATPGNAVAFGRYDWVSNGTTGTISEFGPDSSHFVRTVNPNQQATLAGNIINYKGSLWHQVITSSAIFQRSGTTGKVIKKIALSSDEITDPDFIALVNGNIWVSSYSTDTLVEINAASGQLINTETAPYQRATSSDTVNGNDVWFSGDGSLSEFNGDGGAFIRAVRAPNHNVRVDLNLASGGGDIWMADAQRQSLTELDASNGKSVRVITKSAGDFNWPINVVFRDGDAWVVNQNGNSVSEIDAASGTLIRKLS